jgi:hypothetical protein
MPSEWTTVKAKTNVPIKVELVYVNYRKSKREDWADQLELKGTFDGAENCRMFVPLSLENLLHEGGYIDRTGGDDNFGQPAFEVLDPGPFELLKAEIDGGKTQYQVGALAGTKPQRPAIPPAAARTASKASTAAPPTGAVTEAMLVEAWERAGRLAIGVIERLKMVKHQDGDSLYKHQFTLFQELKAHGLAFQAPQEPESFEEMPGALQDDEDDPLPF